MRGLPPEVEGELTAQGFSKTDFETHKESLLLVHKFATMDRINVRTDHAVATL
eukprot:gene29982-65957_t